MIFLSGKAEQESIDLGISEGASDFITKPFKMNELIQRLKEILVLDVSKSE